MIRFYSPDIESTHKLPEIESGHCVRVLRMREGDNIHVVDGVGSSFVCRITEANPKATELEILNKTVEPNPWKGHITIAVAPTKNIDRIEWFVEKAVEMGIDRIVMLKCAHSERKNINLDRLKKIAVAAMKQSLKARLPEVEGLVDINEFLCEATGGCRFMGYCDAQTQRKELVKEYRPRHEVTILIGPEGDFSPEEVSAAEKAGFIPVTFGETRLRTETAALFSLAAIHTINQLNS